MKMLALAAMLAVSPALSVAQTTAPRNMQDNANRTDSQRGASSRSPGQQMQSKGSVAGKPGASGYAPGQRQNTR